MSTNKTPNLKLHAWEETDRFTLPEFNENFAAIDAFAGGLCKKLTDLSMPVNGPMVSFSIKGWENHSLIVLSFTNVGSGARLTAGCNGAGGKGSYVPVDGSAESKTGFMGGQMENGLLALLFVNHGYGNVHGFYVSDNLYRTSYPASASELRTIEFRSSSSSAYPLLAGARLEVWGLL